ncbi:hypothetical protein F4778DRAFT_775594 [Xylariomycetidae sp. FL2044]|nr:hypothetical protein F4778DRAFT_775594 [Xylariomycetidae sp. FL2044]
MSKVARPVPKDIVELKSLEARVIWEYIGHGPPLNARRTLDQYGSPPLRDTSARDDDQILYKITKGRHGPFKKSRDMYRVDQDSVPLSAMSPSPASRLASVADALVKTDKADLSDETDSDLEKDLLNGKGLMVDQLWLWDVDSTTLMTFFAKREYHLDECPLFQKGDLRNSVYSELNGDLTGHCDNAWDLAAFVTPHAVTVLLDRTSHLDLEIFRVFDEAIETLLEDNKSHSIKARHEREIKKAEKQNRENTSSLLELRDMEDELHTLDDLSTDLTKNGQALPLEWLAQLEEYRRQVHDMVQRVDSTRKDYEKLQEMVRRQAQVDEARWTRPQTELARSQILSVMIFTTFTVIFLPLSFFTSLF